MKNIKKYIVLILLALFTLFLIIVNLIGNAKINKDHVYVIGIITDASFSSRGTTNDYHYYYFNKKYNGRTTSIGWHKKINDLFFLKILPSDPSIGGIEDTPVPSCLTMESVPKEGWKEIPKDTCK
jgi:hypothetical protein